MECIVCEIDVYYTTKSFINKEIYLYLREQSGI